MVKFLIIILGVGWLLGQLIRYFLRSKLAQFAKQVNEAAMEQQRAQQRAQSKKDVNVDFIPREQEEKRRKDIQGGEYIDYEEVKE
ncbi:DUF4834 family protein [Algoriphagus mannitolivorans]|uniref:DUF4834 family protein n=1 Tax=Algoriphagus mannitolivorans TaxID=226504 RepID=UPI00041B9631|nr:DUF4834 family protein [Algoriphagus mannitolivorans]